MPMTRKDFISLADALIASKPVQHGSNEPFPSGVEAGKLHQWEHMQDRLADWCAAQNPRFNRGRWLGYIAGTNGPSGGKALMPKTQDPVFKLDLAFPITLTQQSPNQFTVQYGRQVRDELTYEQAAVELGYSILHALACDARINNSEDTD